MLTVKQVKEIRGHLEKAQNPLFFFDNDQDGLCSFLLLQRFIGRGKGVAIKSYPGLSKEYFRKVHELNADYIFILDKPVVDQEFFEEAEKVNLPVTWIDHHPIDKKTIPKFVNYYNPLFNKTKKSEPVTALCYQIANQEKDEWLAAVGCIADRFIPEFYESFQKKNPDLTPKKKDHFEIFYKSDLGKITRILGFGLKDTTSNVVKMMKFLMVANGPRDVLEDNVKSRSLHHKFEQVETKYRDLLEKAKSAGDASGKLLFFRYGGEITMSSDLANELNYEFPDKVVIVLSPKGPKLNFSMRGKKVRDILAKAIKDIPEARGGGHEMAVGGQINTEDVEKLRENLEKVISGK